MPDLDLTFRMTVEVQVQLAPIAPDETKETLDESDFELDAENAVRVALENADLDWAFGAGISGYNVVKSKIRTEL